MIAIMLEKHNPLTDACDHMSGAGAEWTKLHKPTGKFKVFWKEGDFDDHYTIKYMSKHGIDKVRGGSFVSNILSQPEIECINKMVCSAKDNCFKCGENGHFARECPQKTSVCFRCGGKGHFARECSSSEISKSCYTCGKSGHLSKDCSSSRKEFQGMSCHKCEKFGHYARECPNVFQRIQYCSSEQ